MVEKEYHYTLVSNEARIDIRWKMIGKKITFFAINLGLLKGDSIEEVYRVDTAHGYLHEQRFWVSPRPKRLDQTDYNTAFVQKKEQVITNMKRWVELYKKVKGYE